MTTDRRLWPAYLTGIILAAAVWLGGNLIDADERVTWHGVERVAP